MGLILLIVLIALVLGGLPRWGYSRDRGLHPQQPLGTAIGGRDRASAHGVHPPRLLSRRSLTQPKLI
jgi:hypothetical protein